MVGRISKWRRQVSDEKGGNEGELTEGGEEKEISNEEISRENKTSRASKQTQQTPRPGQRRKTRSGEQEFKEERKQTVYIY